MLGQNILDSECHAISLWYRLSASGRVATLLKSKAKIPENGYWVIHCRHSTKH